MEWNFETCFISMYHLPYELDTNVDGCMFVKIYKYVLGVRKPDGVRFVYRLDRFRQRCTLCLGSQHYDFLTRELTVLL